jgi:hypothetical protein
VDCIFAVRFEKREKFFAGYRKRLGKGRRCKRFFIRVLESISGKKSLQKDLERMKINTYLCNPETPHRQISS